MNSSQSILNTILYTRIVKNTSSKHNYINYICFNKRIYKYTFHSFHKIRFKLFILTLLKRKVSISILASE